MQPSIKENSNNTWAGFDSATYFNNDALNKSYLHFPYGVGNKNQSSCPDMITGWKITPLGDTIIALKGKTEIDLLRH